MRESSPPPGLLSGLTSDQRELVIRKAERRDCSANQEIVGIGKPATRLFQLTKGTAKFYRATTEGNEILMWWLSAGDIFGIGALLTRPWRYIGTAQAVSDCEMLVWTRESIQSLPSVIHETITVNSLHIAMNALAEYGDRMVEIKTETAEQRLGTHSPSTCPSNGNRPTDRSGRHDYERRPRSPCERRDVHGKPTDAEVGTRRLD